MEYNKGLCRTCDFDATCTFNRIFPLFFCEEFFITETVEKQNAQRFNPANSYDEETMENCFCGE